MLNIANLTPGQFRIDLKAKIIELIVSLETRHENDSEDDSEDVNLKATRSTCSSSSSTELKQSGPTIHIYEYLIGDNTGCIVLNTKSELQIDSVYDIKHAYTETVEGYLRLYATEIELDLSTKFNDINTQNNRSDTFLEKKVY